MEHLHGLNWGRPLAAPFLLRMRQAFHRGPFFAGLFILGFCNGVFERILGETREIPLGDAILGTFGISILVWAACWIAVSFLLRQPPAPLTRSDWIAGLAITAGTLIPSSQLSWIALTGLGLYGLRSFEAGSPGRRGAFLIIAVTVPMFWSRLVFAMLSDLILQADAILVSLMVGTPRVGNTVEFADQWGYLVIAPPCSSLANISLSVLGLAIFTQLYSRPPSFKDVWWCLAACLGVIIVNVTRIALMGLYREHFDLIHGTAGAGIASFLTLAVIISVNMLRVRDEVFARS